MIFRSVLSLESRGLAGGVLSIVNARAFDVVVLPDPSVAIANTRYSPGNIVETKTPLRSFATAVGVATTLDTRTPARVRISNRTTPAASTPVTLVENESPCCVIVTASLFERPVSRSVASRGGSLKLGGSRSTVQATLAVVLPGLSSASIMPAFATRSS